MENKKMISIVLGLMCVALTIGICMQIRTVNDYSTKIGQNYDQNNLRAEVLKYKEKYENKVKDIEKVDAELEQKIDTASKNNTDLEDARNQIAEGNKLIGLTEVKGEGVIVTLSDSVLDASTVLNPSSLVVHDLDVFYVINELKNAGAEAISVNGQRIVTTTAIECGGNIITVNGEKIGAPFEIKAIGLPENLKNLDRAGGYLERMREEAVGAELKKAKSVTIPKYSGIIKFKYAHSIEE